MCFTAWGVTHAVCTRGLHYDVMLSVVLFCPFWLDEFPGGNEWLREWVSPVLRFHALWDVCLPFRAFMVSGSGMRTWLCCLFGSALVWLPAFTPSIPPMLVMNGSSWFLFWRVDPTSWLALHT